jgi:hypothetical protein
MSKKGDATAELEQLFEKLHGFLVNSQHAKALKLIESSRRRYTHTAALQSLSC